MILIKEMQYSKKKIKGTRRYYDIFLLKMIFQLINMNYLYFFFFSKKNVGTVTRFFVFALLIMKAY